MVRSRLELLARHAALLSVDIVTPVGASIVSCRVESRHPVAVGAGCIPGFLDFARNDNPSSWCAYVHRWWHPYGHRTRLLDQVHRHANLCKKQHAVVRAAADAPTNPIL